MKNSKKDKVLEKNSKDNELYYFEDGLLVMTEKYHLQRGYCCENKCRHCPFKDKQ